jgi:protein gp37
MTAIEWTDTVWNPTTGCDRVSPGCDNCYAMTMARRLKGMGSEKYQRDGDPRTSGPGFGVSIHPATLSEPLRWRKPRRVFVNSMSDLFHDDIPQSFLAQVFAVMARTPQHTYQVLTKRHGRMRSLLNTGAFAWQVQQTAERADPDFDDPPGWWPLPNVWLGVSVEDQKRADLRIPALLDTPAAVRFLSCEPLLGPVSIWEHLSNPSNRRRLSGRPLPHLDWVIIGGESGPGARRMELDWAQSLVDQCQAAAIAPFVKQLGSAHGPHKGGDIDTWPAELQVREYPAAVA